MRSNISNKKNLDVCLTIFISVICGMPVAAMSHVSFTV